MLKLFRISLWLVFPILHLGNDLPDEDIDIGGNEPPVSSYPPKEIEKDTAIKSSKRVSPGSSSGKLFVDATIYLLFDL